jgi:hypothetical protein
MPSRVTRATTRKYRRHLPRGVVQKEHLKFAKSRFLEGVAYLLAVFQTDKPEQYKFTSAVRVVQFVNRSTHPDLVGCRGVVFESGHGYYKVLTLKKSPHPAMNPFLTEVINTPEYEKNTIQPIIVWLNPY